MKKEKNGPSPCAARRKPRFAWEALCLLRLGHYGDVVPTTAVAYSYTDAPRERFWQFADHFGLARLGPYRSIASETDFQHARRVVSKSG